MQPMHPSNALDIESTKTVVVYDPRSGKIRHLHQVITLRGGKSVSQEEVAREALKHASNSGINVSKMAVLHVAPDAIQPGRRYSVDHRRGTVVELPVPCQVARKWKRAGILPWFQSRG